MLSGLANLNPQDYQKVQEETRDSLITIIKTKHSSFYNWLTENKIDLKDLSAYSTVLAGAAAAIVIGTQPPKAQDIIKKLEPQVQEVKTEELFGLNEEQRAELIIKRYGHIIARVSGKYQLDPRLIFATIMTESSGDTYAYRYEPRINDASYGLGQILYGTAVGIGFEGQPKTLYDPEVNIELIGRYHKRNLLVYGKDLSVEQLASTYNTGSPYNIAYPGHINKFMKWFDRASNLIA